MNGQWRIYFSNNAEKFLKKMKERDITGRILKAVNELKGGPFARHYVKLAGMENTFRIRVGDYRVTYEVLSGSNSIKILEIGHRQNIYEK